MSGYTVAVWKTIKKPEGTELDSERWWHVRDIAFYVPGDEPHVPTSKEALRWGWYWCPDLTQEDLNDLMEPVMETVGLDQVVKTPRKRKIDAALLRDQLDAEKAAIDDAVMDPKTSYEYDAENFPTLTRAELVPAVTDKTKPEVSR